MDGIAKWQINMLSAILCLYYKYHIVLMFYKIN